MRANATFGFWVVLVAAASVTHSQEAHYTAAQAERGRALYQNACASCHGAELTDGAASPLAGPRFAQRWSPGPTVADFFGWGGSSVDDRSVPGMSSLRFDSSLVPHVGGFSPGEAPLQQALCHYCFTLYLVIQFENV